MDAVLYSAYKTFIQQCFLCNPFSQFFCLVVDKGKTNLIGIDTPFVAQPHLGIGIKAESLASAFRHPVNPVPKHSGAVLLPAAAFLFIPDQNDPNAMQFGIPALKNRLRDIHLAKSRELEGWELYGTQRWLPRS
jgi:hypothetical protein